MFSKTINAFEDKLNNLKIIKNNDLSKLIKII